MAETGATSSIEDQIRLREQKAQQLREKGAHPYGNGVVVPHTTGFVRTRHAADDASALAAEPSESYGIAGRIVALRSMGKATFVSLRDRDGDLQVFIKKDKVGEQAYEVLKLADLGDIAFARGSAMRTRTGELSIEAAEFRLLTKALRPLRRSGMASPITRRATGSATSTFPRASRCARFSSGARSSSPASAASWTSAITSRSRRPSCTSRRKRAERRRGRSRRTTTRSISI